MSEGTEMVGRDPVTSLAALGLRAQGGREAQITGLSVEEPVYRSCRQKAVQ